MNIEAGHRGYGSFATDPAEAYGSVCVVRTRPDLTLRADGSIVVSAP